MFEEVGLRRILMKKREVERFKDGMTKMCLQQLRCQWEPLTMNEQETQSRVVQGSREVVGRLWNQCWVDLKSWVGICTLLLNVEPL